MKTLALVLVGTVTACAAAVSAPPAISPGRVVHTETAPSAPFARYHTFAFRLASTPPSPFTVSARSFEVERRMRLLIVNELLSKGYVEQTGDGPPDFFLRIASGYSKETVSSNAEPGSEWSPPKREIQKGEIVIDAFDAASDTHVWHGSSVAEVDPEKIDDTRLQSGVRQVMLTFPARGADAAQPAAASNPAR